MTKKEVAGADGNKGEEMKIEHIALTHPGQVFTMGVDDPERLKSSELKVLVCPGSTYYSRSELKYALTRLRAGDLQIVVTNEDSWVNDLVRDVIGSAKHE